MPFEGLLKVSGVFGVNKLALFDSCGGNEVSCFSGFGEFSGLEDSTEYWLRYASPFGNATATLDTFEVEAVMSVGIGDFEEHHFKLYPNTGREYLIVE